MLDLIKISLQYAVIGIYVALSAIGFIQHDYNLGFGVNFALIFLYWFLYFQPIK